MGRKYQGLGAAILDVIKDAEPDHDDAQPDYMLSLLEATGVKTKGVKANSPEYLDLLAGADMAKIKAADDAARAAQQERATTYAISVKDGGNITKPSAWADIPDDDFADPVNYQGPMPDKGHADTAAAHLAKSGGWAATYSADERTLVEGRIQRRQKTFEHSKAVFKEQAEREKVAGITVKAIPSYAPGVSDPVDGSEFEPTAYADFTHYQFRIDTPEAVTAARADWEACKRFNPGLYEDGERAVIEQKIAMAEMHVKADKPAMVGCPGCGKKIPEGTKTCPFCGKKIPGGAGSGADPDGDGDDDSTNAGDTDNDQQTKRADFGTDVDALALAMKTAYESGDKDAIVATTKRAMLLSAEVGGRQTVIKQSEVQGILEHALHMGATCPVCHQSAPKGVNKGVDAVERLTRERDEAAAELARVKAAAPSDSALDRAKESEDERERLELEIRQERAKSAGLVKDLQAQSQRAEAAERRLKSVTPSRSPVSVGHMGTAVRTFETADIQPGPQTFEELRRKRHEGEK